MTFFPLTISFNHITSSNDLNVKTIILHWPYLYHLPVLLERSWNDWKVTCINLTGSVELERAQWLLHNNRSPLHGQEQMIRWSCVISSRTFWIKFAPIPCK